VSHCPECGTDLEQGAAKPKTKGRKDKGGTKDKGTRQGAHPHGPTEPPPLRVR
jgi:hypothetical protein